MLRIYGVLMAATGLFAAIPGRAAESACTQLLALRVPKVELTLAAQAQDVLQPDAAGPSTPTSLAAPICRVAGIARPSSRSRVRFELWIPLGTAWNGNYMQLGSGGFAGRMPYEELARYAGRGYAVGATDDGHTSADFTDARWALGEPEKIRDFAHRGVKSVHDAARAILRGYAGHAPAHAYFVGCSNGGREALQTAQLDPRDFDGIVAGAPAVYMTSLLAQMGAVARHLAAPGGALAVTKLPIIERAVLAACDGTHGYVPNIARCGFDPQVLSCETRPPGAPTGDCLTIAEVETVRKIYAGSRDLQTGAPLPGPSPGAEAEPGSWLGWIIGFGPEPQDQSGIEGFSRNFYAYFVREAPALTVQQLTPRDFEAGHAKFGSILDAANPDLREFSAAGGKLIQYHGANDPGIPSGYSTHYFRSVQAKLGDPSAFYRLFIVPGMLHCGGGAAPSDVDWLGALEAWVERGEAPDNLRARWPAAAKPRAGAVAEQDLSRYRP